MQMLFMALFLFATSAAPVESVDARYAHIIEYRRSIEAKAYRETLKLCRALKFTRGGDWRAWARVVGAGLDQPLSAIGGFKADYIDATQLHAWDFDNWFRSVRSLYLTHAPGFREAGLQCLGSEAAVDRLATAVHTVDVAGTLTTEALMFVGLGHLTAFVLRTTRFAWVPLFDLIKRAPISPRLAKGAGWTMVGGGAVALTVYLDHVRQGVLRAKNFLDHIDDERAGLVRTRRILLMSEASKRLDAAVALNRASDFETWARENVTKKDLDLAHQDAADYHGGYREGDGTDDDYAFVLRGVLPALDQVELAG